MIKTSWWKGRRGEWYVAGQAALFLLVVFGPRAWPGAPAWMPPLTWLGTVIGVVLLTAGGLLSTAGLIGLGANLTPLPYPREQATLVENGPYRLVRHPIYSGLFFMALGWGFLVHGWLTILYATMLLAFLDRKSRREEQWLEERFPGYAAYRHRVKKLIPFVY